jgi:hypothetical protein
MTLIRVLVSLLWVFAAIAGHELWTPRVSAVHRPPHSTSISPAQRTDRGAPLQAAPGVQPRIDVYGNEIDEAVGDYRVDPRGDMYERHSPDTALLVLTPAGA